MPSKPFVPASAYSKLIPALNQGTVTFTRKDGKVMSEAPPALDAEGKVIAAPPVAQAKWSTPAMFKYDAKGLVNGQWQGVTRLTVPVPPSYVIKPEDVVTWPGFKGRVVRVKAIGSSDLPSAYQVEVTG
ncbi:hypothetical protein [Brevundimonas sp.]|uniref:hypothetical protein n=1 Tax=Brevundimonas sp. TaxID=1871086 RepID=UPI00289B1B4B|nr:hypothetical protein [Brevundimonas sp.]